MKLLDVEFDLPSFPAVSYNLYCVRYLSEISLLRIRVTCPGLFDVGFSSVVLKPQNCSL